MNEQLRALRCARGWTQQQAADAVRAAVLTATGREGSGVDQAWIGRLERGRLTWPGAEYRAALRAVYGVAADEDLGLRGVRIASPAPTARTPGELERLRTGLGRTVTDGALAPAALEDLEQEAVRYGLITRDRPASLLLADLVADLAEVQALMDRPRPPSTSLRLTRVAAQLCGLMCLTLVKLDQRGQFRRWSRVSRATARETGDPAMISWVLAQEAYGHYYAENLGEALSVAREAQAAAGGGPRAGAVLAAALEARVLGAMGQRAGCQHALDRAEAGLSRLPAEQVGDSAFGYDEGQLRFHEGNAYTHLGDTAAAWPAQQRALELFGPADFMDRAFARLDRAACLIGARELEAGLAYALETVSALTVQQRTGIITTRAAQLLETLPADERRALPTAADLSALLHTP